MCLDGLGPPAIDHARKGEHPGEPQHVALALGAPLAFAAVERVAGRRREPAKALELSRAAPLESAVFSAPSSCGFWRA